MLRNLLIEIYKYRNDSRFEITQEDCFFFFFTISSAVKLLTYSKKKFQNFIQLELQ